MGYLRAMEGRRVRSRYEELAQKYQVGWVGRSFKPGKFDMSDTTNKILTASNAALYALVLSVVYTLGYSPHVGFIHSGSPLPFVYDIADLYKDSLTIELAFGLTLQLGGSYNRGAVSEAFNQKVVKMNLLKRMPDDINNVLYGKTSRVSRHSS